MVVIVRVETTNGRSYFWNPVDDTATWTRPENVELVWEAAQTQNERAWYYWNKHTRESTWEPPGRSPLSALCDSAVIATPSAAGVSSTGSWQLTIAYRGPLVPQQAVLQRKEKRKGRPPGIEDSEFRHWFQIDVAMAVASTCSSVSEKYRGQVGTICAIEDNEVTLRLPDQLGGCCVRIPARDLIPLPVGTIVQLPASIDGEREQVGTIVQEESPNRTDGGIRMVGAMEPEYRVNLVSGPDVSVSAREVTPRCRVWTLDVTQSSCWLQWRKEQTCLFIASSGEHHHFTIHLPFEFEPWRKLPQEERTPWPMLVYLHGTGGSGFFATSKKALKSTGMNYAASKFVIVSPRCEWTWKDTPPPWVGELAATLKAADFIDHHRIYLSGCSMGGMGVWEISAQSPELFAAVAPIAAHHKAEHADKIARKLGDMPIFICHSRADTTCPMRLESELWMKIRKTNRRMQINLMEHVDHCSVFEKVYCDDIRLYDWLLMHRLDMRDAGIIH